MSEYQYYEWQTIDRALTAAEQTAVGKLSSHIDVTSTRAWVEYHWGDFKHDPKQVLTRYFDAFLYYANLGCQRLAFRFPKGVLKDLSAPLAEFVSFFQLKPFLVQAAAQASRPLRPAPAPALDALIARLPRAECDAFLRQLAEGEPLLALKFNRRLQELAGPSARPRATATRRTWAELRNTAEWLRQAEERRHQAETEARRIKDLQDFAPRAPQAWCDAEALIEEKKARPYDDAVALLVNLRDLAVFQDRLAEFEAHLSSLQAQYAGRPAFQERLRKAGLV